MGWFHPPAMPPRPAATGPHLGRELPHNAAEHSSLPIVIAGVSDMYPYIFAPPDPPTWEIPGLDPARRAEIERIVCYGSATKTPEEEAEIRRKQREERRASYFRASSRRFHEQGIPISPPRSRESSPLIMTLSAPSTAVRLEPSDQGFQGSVFTPRVTESTNSIHAFPRPFPPSRTRKSTKVTKRTYKTRMTSRKHSPALLELEFLGRKTYAKYQKVDASLSPGAMARS